MIVELYALLLGAGVLQVVLMLVHAHEHRRYHRVRSQPATSLAAPSRVLLVCPCRGIDLDQESQFQALFQQDHPNYELCFVVQSATEPALATIDRLRSQYPDVISRVVVAGLAINRGQKVHNLLAALRTAGPHVGLFAFVDSDARLRMDWLRRLVGRLESSRPAICTGYRWQVATRASLPNRLLTGINNALCTLAGPHRYSLVWGGAWAIRRDVFEQLGLPGAWEGCLNDDLRVSQLAKQAGVRIVYEPNCLVTSPVDVNFFGLGEFLRRQYLQSRIWVPSHWRAALASATFSTLLIGFSLNGAAVMALTGGPWWTFLLGGGLYYLLGVVRLTIGTRSVLPFLPAEVAARETWIPFLAWAWPLLSAVNLIGLIAGGIGNRLTWRGIRYEIRSATETVVLDALSPESVPLTSSEPPGTSRHSAHEHLHGPHALGSTKPREGLALPTTDGQP